MASTDRGRILEAAIALAKGSEQLVSKYNDIKSDPTKLYCVIEKHDKTCDPANPVEDDFQWINCLFRTKLKKLYAAYRGLTADHADTLLMIGDMVLPETGTMADLPPPTDGILLVKATKPEQQTASQTVSGASSQGTRQPLQPVNRQLTALPKRSADEAALKRERSLSAPPPPAAAAQTSMTAPATAWGSSRSLHSYAYAHESSADISHVHTPLQPTPDQENNEEPAEEPEQEYQPRAQDNLFAASQDDHELDSTERGLPLAQLATEENPERLEAGVQAGLKVLSELEVPLKELGANEDAHSYLTLIDRARKEAVQTRTVVGVVGNTGAGKSSVINAMLDEERLVPTNCMRACTAVVTELSYNFSNIESAKYRAEIEFIKPEDWRKELDILFREVLDDYGGISKEVGNPDSEAGIAYAKMRSVYNKKTREMLANSSIEALMNDKKIKSILGTTKRINSRDPDTFYRSLQKVIDSKEKGQEKRNKNGDIIHNVKRDFEHWPLIKVVKIYLKAPALSTGAVIVDLPGVHDSNAARAAVAEGYMKQCTGLWIVAPINRAVDDKAAKTLLGDSFKRQLKYDGTYSAVTFICSKTDDISRTEAADSLQLGDQMTDLDTKQEEIDERRSKLKEKKKEAQDDAKDQEAAYDDLDSTIEVWEELLTKLEDGKTVYAPDLSKKRKASSASPPPRKRARRTVDSEDEAEDESNETAEQDASEPERQALTEDEIDKKLEELKRLKKEARRAKNASKLRVDEVSDDLKSLDKEEAEIEAKKSAICIAGRNAYSRGAIQQDFAQGIRELDQETAEEEDPDNFNPEEDRRDYAEVARSLPVFCVSSRAYQKLSGRMKKDNAVPGFTDISETEIPQLQAHAKKLTVKGRQASCRRFLNSVKQLILSLALWSSDDGTGIKLTSQQRDVEKTFLSRKLQELEKHLEKVAQNTLKDAADELHDHLFAKLEPAIDAAVKQAGPKAASWGLPKPAGGTPYSTYRAVIRRSGVYDSKTIGLRDFNSDLTEPLLKHLASAWEKTFQRRLPNILQSFKKSATSVVKQSHAAIETRTRERGTGAARLNLLAQQLDQYSATFGDLCIHSVETLNEGQREINREFTPAITAAMEVAYTAADEENGRGCFQRIKGRINDHIANSKQQMFQSASLEVKRKLVKLCKTIEESMLNKADEVYVLMLRDYTSVLNGVNAEVKMSREERSTRREVDQLITAADKHFKEVTEGTLDELKDKFSMSTPEKEDTEDAVNDFMDVDDFANDEDESEAEDANENEDGADSADGDNDFATGTAASDVDDVSMQRDNDGDYMEH